MIRGLPFPSVRTLTHFARRLLEGHSWPQSDGEIELEKFSQLPPTLSAENFLNAQNRKEIAVVAGNGPSINSTNLDRLEGLPLFVCNFANRVPGLLELQPRHWVWADPMTEWPDDVLNAMSQADSRVMFYVTRAPSEGPPGIDEERIQRLRARKRLLGSAHYPLPLSSLRQIADFRSFYGVRHSPMLSVQLALHFGYKKIVLIGLEHDYAFRTLGPDNLVVTHAYEESPVEIEVLHQRTVLRFAEELRKTWGMYASLQNLALLHGATIVDATPEGRLDVFPRIDL